MEMHSTEVRKSGFKVGAIELTKLSERVTLAMTVLIYCLISLGGLVRNEGAGLSCPDWPLCFGKVVPPMSYQVFLEWFHRLIAGSVSVGLVLVGAIFLANQSLRKKFFKHWLFCLTLLFSQVVLGGLTVLGLLDPKWVSSHLVFGLGFFSSILILHLRLADELKGRKSKRNFKSFLFKISALTTTVLFTQVFLGGLVSSNYAGLACPDFPTCNGQWLPALQGLVKFQVLHRIGALISSTAILGYVLYLWSQTSKATAEKLFSSRAKMGLWLLPGLLGAQISLGVGAVLFSLPLLISVAHLAVATAILGLLMTLTYEAADVY